MEDSPQVAVNLDNLENPSANPLETLEHIGPIWRAVSGGVLHAQVKRLLRMLTPTQRHAFLSASGRAPRLLAQICMHGEIAEVRYAFETLELHKIRWVVRRHTAQLCPLVSALASPRPSLPVIKYIFSQGYPVTQEAFFAWAFSSADRRHLAAILDFLLVHGKDSMPPVDRLISRMANPRGSGPVGTYLDRRSTHIDILRRFIIFKYSDCQRAAYHGLGQMLEQMAEGNRGMDPDALSNLFELCEFYKFHRSRNFPEDLRYFRKSISIRQSPDTRRRVSFRSWTKFESLEDIERIEQQMANGDYLECNWQMLLAAASAEAYKSEVNFEAMKGLNNLDQVLEVKAFVLTSGLFQGEQDAFLRALKKRCDAIVQDSSEPSLTILPKIYDCLKELFIEPDSGLLTPLEATINAVFVGSSDAPNRLEQLDLVRDRRDELLFLATYALSSMEPNRALGNSAQLSLPIIAHLLQLGATLGALRGHRQSNLRHLMSSVVEINPLLRQYLRAHLCCWLDLSREERQILGFPEKITGPPRLKCIAAAECKKLPVKVLEENLPCHLARIAAGHLPVTYSDSPEDVDLQIPPI